MSSPIKLPEVITLEWVSQVRETLYESSKHGVTALKAVLPKDVAIALLARTERLLDKEPPLLEVVPPSAETSIIVVGDTHGQYHDVCHMLEVAGTPCEERMFVFNGDFVDRGAWGMETLVLLCCFKLALPRHVFMLRGNHETATCAIMYGFKGELEAKYGKGAWKPVFTACKKLFAALPLAAHINRRTLVLHGGLFRRQPQRTKGASKRKNADECVVGSLADLRKASKGGLDPGGLGASRLCTDVQWSDPSNEDGFMENEARGIGMVFGPDITEQFLRDNDLGLIIRSHEGPDAREDREGMGNMLEGYTIDHVTQSGRLLTVFSAPDYPQFMADEANRYRNKAAVAILSGPGYDDPNLVQYEAVLPRPEARPYYDLFVNDSDEEFEPVPSTASGMTDVKRGRDGDSEVQGQSPKAAEEVEIASSPRAKRARSRSPVGTVSPTRSPSKQHGRTGSSPTRR